MSKANDRTQAVVDGILRVATETGITNRGKLAEELNRRGIATPTGLKWEAQPLRNFINRKGHESLKAKLHEIAQQSIVTPEEPGTATHAMHEEPLSVSGNDTPSATHLESGKPTTDAAEEAPHTDTTAAIQSAQADVSGADTTLATLSDPTEAQGETTTDASQQEPGMSTTGAIQDIQADVQGTTTSPATQLDAETIATLLDVVEWWRKRTAEGEVRESAQRTQEPEHRPVFVGKKRNTGIRINSRLLTDALAKSQKPEEAKKLGGGGLSPLIERLLWQYLGFDPRYREPDA